MNDLAMAAASPLGISASFILEEGYPTEELERVISSIKEAAIVGRVVDDNPGSVLLK